MLDHDGMAGVPHTGLVEAWHPAFSNPSGKVEALVESSNTSSQSTVQRKIGSFQEFVPFDSMVGDWAPNKFPVKEVQKIAILDMRLLNTDRNDANILLQWRESEDGSRRVPYLIPIDHGYCMPDTLEVAWCDWVWSEWPQIKEPIDPALKDYISKLDIERDIRLLRSQLSVREECLQNIRVTGTVLKAGVAAGLTLYDIASILCRQDLDTPSPVESLVDRVNRISQNFNSGFSVSPTNLDVEAVNGLSPKILEEEESSNGNENVKETMDIDPEACDDTKEKMVQEHTPQRYFSDGSISHPSTGSSTEAHKDLFLPPTPSRKPLNGSLKVKIDTLDPAQSVPLPPSPTYSQDSVDGSRQEDLSDTMKERKDSDDMNICSIVDKHTTVDEALRKLPENSPLKLERPTRMALAAASAKAAARAAAAVPGRQGARVDVREFVKVSRLVDASDKLHSKTGLVLCIATAMSTDAHLLRPLKHLEEETHTTEDKVIDNPSSHLARYTSCNSEGNNNLPAASGNSCPLVRPAGAVTAVSAACVWGGRLTTVVVTPQGRDVVFLTESETDNALGQAVAAVLSAAATAPLSVLEATSLGLGKAATSSSNKSDSGSTKLSSLYGEDDSASQGSPYHETQYTARPLMRCLLASIREATGQSYIRPESHFYSYLSGANEMVGSSASEEDLQKGEADNDGHSIGSGGFGVPDKSPKLNGTKVPIASAQSAPLNPAKADLRDVPGLELEPTGFNDDFASGLKRSEGETEDNCALKPQTVRRQVRRSRFRKSDRQRSFSFHGDSPVEEERDRREYQDQRPRFPEKPQHNPTRKRSVGKRIEAAAKWVGSDKVTLQRASSYNSRNDMELPESDVPYIAHSTYIGEKSAERNQSSSPRDSRKRRGKATQKRLFRNDAFVPEQLDAAKHPLTGISNEGQSSFTKWHKSVKPQEYSSGMRKVNSVAGESGSRFVGYDGINRAVLARHRSYQADENNPSESNHMWAIPKRNEVEKEPPTALDGKGTGFSVSMVPISGSSLKSASEDGRSAPGKADDPVANLDISPLNVVVTILGPSSARPHPASSTGSLIYAAERMGQRTGQEALYEAGFGEDEVAQSFQHGAGMSMDLGEKASKFVESLRIQNTSGEAAETPNKEREGSVEEEAKFAQLQRSKRPWKPRWKREGYSSPSPEASPPSDNVETNLNKLESNPDKKGDLSDSQSSQEKLGFDRASPGELNPESLPPTAIDRTFNAPRTRSAMKRSTSHVKASHTVLDDILTHDKQHSLPLSDRVKGKMHTGGKGLSRAASYSAMRDKIQDDNALLEPVFGKQSKFFGKDMTSEDGKQVRKSPESKSPGKTNVGAKWNPYFKSCFDKQLQIYLENKARTVFRNASL